MRHRFAEDALSNPINRTILERLPNLGVPDVWLVAGCIFQSIWNLQAGRPGGDRIKDYDVFYYDSSDLSWEAEDAVIRRGSTLFADLPVAVEIRNQARVPLWFEQRFGTPFPPVASSAESIGRFLVDCTCVGLGPGPDGTVRTTIMGDLTDLYDGRLRLNPRTPNPRLFLDKAESYRRRWPFLRIVG